ncbi:hypothetical protein FOM00_29145 [Pseudomonas sp. ST1]|uniref:hypothetical protein n=1 Tax=Pseudomonas TaxID=286 RepID=UPI0004E27F31|nr:MULTISPECIES: hypothetical protein [Pseudomonas]KPY68480.1 Uncharacterized protein ALO58_02042 [Pseudomonas savastanoi pv. savastanoi]RML83125.1 hypothetical protein ALQ88_200171 [Pseudomonas savastanoi]TSC24713.1 hypothetical protein FOM00_29145 [Pseudomonas sp. ST1]UKL09560.1 hypothetical protein HQ966_26055 [Pseudomonas savastanoi pv. savastanoi]
MTNDLLNAFLEQEFNDSVRELLATAVKKSIKPGAQLAIRGLELNCFDILLNFERGTATLGDVLSSGTNSEQEMPLPFFLRACGLSED